MGKRYTAEEVANFIIDSDWWMQELEGNKMYYSIGVNVDGSLTEKLTNHECCFIASCLVDEEIFGKYFDETDRCFNGDTFESLKNPDFVKICEDLTHQVNDFLTWNEKNL